MARRIERCRISDSSNLVTVLNLGVQAYTGVFPACPEEPIPCGPLELVWCPDSGLLQLAHSFDPQMMYGENYGYRSGLNKSMARHLKDKAHRLSRLVDLRAGDLVLDIGSNDGTLLQGYSTRGITRMGIDPTIVKFREFYDEDILLVGDFFTKETFANAVGKKKAKLITSIAMFYDLDSPISFARDVNACLSENGIWHFEQSYMPSMLRNISYDTVCHEHVSYYSLLTVKRILSASGFEIADVTFNSSNGGSFAVTARKQSGADSQNPYIEWLIEHECRMGLHTPRPFRDFEEKVYEHRQRLTDLIRRLAAMGKKVFGYGASTKGNVLLQFCGFTKDDIPCIVDVNPYKNGRCTPGTHIPIVSDGGETFMGADYLLVLPWHFKHSILEKETEFVAKGGHFIFPMPEIEIV